MPYRLFYADRSAAMGARVILEEVGEAYELIETEIGAGMPRAPELLALNPNGWVPVLGMGARRDIRVCRNCDLSL